MESESGNVEERKGERGVVEEKRRGTWDALCCATRRSAAKPELTDDDKAQAVPRCENKESREAPRAGVASRTTRTQARAECKTYAPAAGSARRRSPRRRRPACSSSPLPRNAAQRARHRRSATVQASIGERAHLPPRPRARCAAPSPRAARRRARHLARRCSCSPPSRVQRRSSCVPKLRRRRGGAHRVSLAACC